MIEAVAETGSTNADLCARLAGGEALAEGFWLVADHQTAGRGRLGRVWNDGAGNFMGSTVVRLGAGDPPAHTLALMAGLAVHEVVAPYVPAPLTPMLKWPNDLLVGGAKLAGLLLERVGEAVVVGIGVNLALAPDVAGRETVSLSRFGPAPDRDTFAQALADTFARELLRWRTYGLGPIVARWQASGHPRGTPMSVSASGSEAGQGALSGLFAGLDDDGALRLALPDGTTRSIHAGEITLA